jgi:hypothetical protein
VKGPLIGIAETAVVVAVCIIAVISAALTGFKDLGTSSGLADLLRDRPRWARARRPRPRSLASRSPDQAEIWEQLIGAGIA